MPLGTAIGLGSGDFVIGGEPSTLGKGTPTPPSFWPMSIEPARWMKTPHGTEVDLGPRHIVLDGVPAPRKRGTEAPPPIFGPCLLWPRSPISATAELLLVYLREPFSSMSPRKKQRYAAGVCAGPKAENFTEFRNIYAMLGVSSRAIFTKLSVCLVGIHSRGSEVTVV